MKSNIALIGFMGTGKSSAGRLLAADLDKKFVETDSLIERKTGRTIHEIFEKEGEPEFRELEREVIGDVARQKNQVISCGGGAVLNRANIENLKKEAIIVWLQASPEEIMRRIAADEGLRPLMKGINNMAGLEELIKYRNPFYAEAADVIVDTADLSLPSVVKRIKNKLQENADFD